MRRSARETRRSDKGDLSGRGGAWMAHEDVVVPVAQAEVVQERGVVHVAEADHVLARREAGRVERHDVAAASLDLELCAGRGEIRGLNPAGAQSVGAGGTRGRVGGAARLAASEPGARGGHSHLRRLPS